MRSPPPKEKMNKQNLKRLLPTGIILAIGILAGVAYQQGSPKENTSDARSQYLHDLAIYRQGACSIAGANRLLTYNVSDRTVVFLCGNNTTTQQVPLEPFGSSEAYAAYMAANNRTNTTAPTDCSGAIEAYYAAHNITL